MALVARADLARATAATAVMAAMVALLMVGRFLVWEALVGQAALVVQVAKAAQAVAQAKLGPQSKAHFRRP